MYLFMLLNKLKKCAHIPLVTLLCAFPAVTNAEKAEFHDVDPRNTQFGVGIATDELGDLKITSNGGASNMYGDGEYQTQLVFMAEYKTQSEQARIRGVNFDERFGGVYADFSLQNVIDLYTVGYMVPLNAVNSNVLFFPSINYTYVDFDTKEAADMLIDNFKDVINIGGVEHSRDAIAEMIKNLALGGDDHASLGSLNLYTLMPWNETHFTLFQATAGASYSGFDMEMLDVYLQQGMRTELGSTSVIVFAEAEYTKINIQGVETTDTSFGFGVNFKF